MPAPDFPTYKPTLRDRIAVRIANFFLIIASKEYRALVKGAIAYGLNAAARDEREQRPAPEPWTEWPTTPIADPTQSIAEVGPTDATADDQGDEPDPVDEPESDETVVETEPIDAEFTARANEVAEFAGTSGGFPAQTAEDAEENCLPQRLADVADRVLEPEQPTAVLSPCQERYLVEIREAGPEGRTYTGHAIQSLRALRTAGLITLDEVENPDAKDGSKKARWTLTAVAIEQA